LRFRVPMTTRRHLLEIGVPENIEFRITPETNRSYGATNDASSATLVLRALLVGASQTKPKRERKEVQMTTPASTDTEGRWTATMAAEDYPDGVVLYQGFAGSSDYEPIEAFIHSDPEPWHRDRHLAEADARRALADMKQLVVMVAGDRSDSSQEVGGDEALRVIAYVVEAVVDKADDAPEDPREFDVENFRYHQVDSLSGAERSDGLEADPA
jgi:hypothetical protein